jgi:hypothetical protein
MMKNDSKINQIVIDENKNFIQAIIRNSLYLFNEFIWLKIVEYPNGWTAKKTDKLKELINRLTNIPDIYEVLLIKSLNDEDKITFKKLLESNSIITKFNKYVDSIRSDITELKNQNEQYNIYLSNTTDLILNRDDIKKQFDANTKEIEEKEKQVEKIQPSAKTSFNEDKIITELYYKIDRSKLIINTDFNFDNYNKLIRDLGGNYLKILEIVNNKNLIYKEKYISYFNNCLMDINIKKLSYDDIDLLNDYNKRIIDNIYSDYYDLDKYEDSEYNYVNHSMIEIIYLNTANIVGLEMRVALLKYLSEKYENVKDVIKNSDDMDNLLDSIIELLKLSIINKLKIQNPELMEKYSPDKIIFEKDSIKKNIFIITDIMENQVDMGYLDNIIKFYIMICENIAYNIYHEMITLMDNLRKRSLLIQILKIIADSKKNK